MNPSDFQATPVDPQPSTPSGPPLKPVPVLTYPEGISPRHSIPTEMSDQSVLCTDMDGTLLRTDALWESLLSLIKFHPLSCLRVPFWLFRGKAYLKAKLAGQYSFSPASLPYHEELLDFLRTQKEAGREIILATGSNRSIAKKVADHVGLFAAVLASNESTNLVGSAKLSALREFLGDRRFDYVGNSKKDLPIWRAAQKSIVVTSSEQVLTEARKVSTVERVFPATRDYFHSVPAALRIHHWAKNMLLFVPIILAHKVFHVDKMIHVMLAFLSFGLLASTGYIVNDLFDLEVDRVHNVKRRRPFASGALPVGLGATCAPLFAGLAFFTAWHTFPVEFVLLLALYFITSVLYSQRLKRIPVLDVLVLAALYTVRILAGSVASDIIVSPWLLSFSMFFFLSLAYVKRFSEMFAHKTKGSVPINGRGYQMADVGLFQTFGPVSGYLSIVIFALYINSQEVSSLYRHTQYLWLIGPLLIYWITRVWLLAERGEMNEDPVLFAIRDKVSYVLGVLVLAILLAAL